MKTLKRHLWVGALAFGLLFIVLGTLFMVIGLDAKDMIRTALADENVLPAQTRWSTVFLPVSSLPTPRLRKHRPK